MTNKEQLQKSTDDIKEIKSSIDTIKNNHLHHIEKDMEKQSRLLDKMDTRLWFVVVLLIGATVIANIEKLL